MKKFSFRLETLLQHRHHLEEKERTKFSGIRNELLAEVDHIQALRTKQAAGSGGTRAEEVGRLRRSGNHLALPVPGPDCPGTGALSHGVLRSWKASLRFRSRS